LTALGERPPPRFRGPFGFVSRADLVDGEADEQQTDDSVQVVLDGAAAGVLGFYPVDDGAECSLREVQDENGDAKFLVSAIQMFGSGLGNRSNSKSYPDNYD